MNISDVMLLPVFFQIIDYTEQIFRCMSEYRKMIFFNSISLSGAGLMYFILGYIPPEQTSLSIFAIATTHAVMAFNVGGFYKCATFVAR